MREHLTYANVVATLCLVLILGSGVAYAANTVFSTDIVNGEVKTVDLANQAVTNAKLADGSVDSDTVADDSLGSRDLRNNAAVQSPDVRNETLTGNDVANEALSGDDIGNESIDGRDVVESALGPVPLANVANSASVASVANVAKIGGLGRWTGGGSCDPENENYLDCAIVTLNLPAPARVLLIGQATASRETDNGDIGLGVCELVSNAGRIVPNSQVEVDTDEFAQSVALTAVTGVQTAGSHDYAVDCNQTEGIGAIEYRDVGISAVALSPD